MLSLGHFGARLYRGEMSFDFIGRRRIWYAVSIALIVISALGVGLRGLNLGVEFIGGSVFQFQAPQATVPQVRSAAAAGGADEIIVQKVTGGKWRVQTESLPPKQVDEMQTTLAKSFDLRPRAISPQVIGPSWGQQISHKAEIALVVFLGLVVLYLSIAFEWKMAVAAIVALLHDLIITTGIYALVGFEVTPATVIGILTILGYSLYDTVVVYDKVRENTAGLLSGSRMTYSQAANLGVNQTLVRSINTSVIALLPVAAILFVSVAFLGTGVLKDLALALFIGIAAGTYSSIFIATPLATELKEREQPMRALARRVQARQTAAAKSQAKAGAEQEARVPAGAGSGADEEPAEVGVSPGSTRRMDQRGPRQQPRRGSKKRPSGKKRR
ncbi:MAG: protein translocase subunit SecF [Streptosporangiaceae bacterium]